MKRYLIRILTMTAGLFSFATGVVLTIRANIGYAPWDVFHVGLANTIGLSIGLTSISVGLVLVLIVTLCGEKLGLGTIINMFAVGLFIDLIFPRIPLAPNPLIGTAMLLLGMLLIALGSYHAIKSALGIGPRDNLMVLLARKTKLPVGLCRGMIELLATGIGWFLGGMIGFGTVLFVILIGLYIQLVFRAFKFDPTAVKHETLRDTCTAIKLLLDQRRQ